MMGRIKNNFKSVDFGDQLGGAPAEALEAVKRLSGLQAAAGFV